MFYEKHFTHNAQLPFNEHKTSLHLIIYEGKLCPSPENHYICRYFGTEKP